jgi:hypothetical protein
MKKVFIVTYGEYSSYSILAVFSEKELADNFVNAFKFSLSCSVEEWDMDTFMEEFKNGFKCWTVVMDKEGVSVSATQSEFHGAYTVIPAIHFTSKGRGREKTHLMELECLAKDRQHAVKIANEKRTKALALNLWGIGKNHEQYKILIS